MRDAAEGWSHISSFREFIDGDRTTRDPRLLSEAVPGTAAGAVSTRLDGELGSDEEAICSAADDPLAQIFNRRLWLWSAGEGRWVNDTALTVGGGAPTHSCAGRLTEG